ncbi:MAG: hypothetical protein KF729_12080 [Sandaracinaceae bacterium]|nr:hypothetical protein [Sandaracinaceae bacterium]
MRRSLVALALSLLPACPSATGPALPPNVGQTHRAERAARAAAPDTAAEPVAVGTTVWAEHRSTGFFFHAVVVERREDEHRVVFADGGAEWVPADGLRPDSLREDARVGVRPDYGARFSQAVVARRVADVVYVRFGSGDEEWAGLAQLRFEPGDPGTPQRGDAPFERSAAEPLGPGAGVLVNYQDAGLWFAGTVTARGDDGRLHVVYLDSTAEWTDPRLVAPDALGPGAVVHVRRRWDPADWVRGRVRERLGHALSVELDDGGLAWSSMFRVRLPTPLPQGQTDATGAQPPAAQDRQAPQSALDAATGSTRIAMGDRVSPPISTTLHP